MPFNKIRGASVPSSPIGDKKLVGHEKAASLPDLRGKLTRSAGSIYEARTTEPIEVPRSDVSTHSSGNRRTQPSYHQAKVVPAPDLVPVTNTGESMEPEVAEKPKTGKKKAKQMQGPQPAPAKAVGKGASPQVSSELIAEVKSLVTAATPEQLKATGGNLMKLAGIDESRHKDALGSNDQLSQVFKFTYDRLSKGGRNFPVDFAYKLMAEFEDRAKKLKGPKVASASVKKSTPVSKVKVAKKLTLEQTPGLQDMFLARAINQLITKELHKLDPLVGDEGCQLRTPFALDMFDLVQGELKKSIYKSSAGDLVSEYRKATDEEQAAAIARMKELETMRTHKDPRYETAASEFIHSEALKASMAAKSGSYQEMFTCLMAAIENSGPRAKEYLEHLESETLSWGHGVDPFGVEVMNFKDPILPDKILGKRKVEQAECSKSYFVKTLKDLLQAKGIAVEGTVTKTV